MRLEFSQCLFEHRLKWYKFNAANFIKQYQTGVLIFFAMVPGIINHFGVFLQFITTPFRIINEQSEPVYLQAVCLLLLLLVYSAWSLAQKQAINGGQFRLFLKSQPINNATRFLCNLCMLLISNHLLWLVIVASFFFIHHSDDIEYMHAFIRHINLIFLLIVCQYIAVFELKKLWFYILLLGGFYLLHFSTITGLIHELFMFMCMILFSWNKLLNAQVKQDLCKQSLLKKRFMLNSINTQILLHQNFKDFAFRLALITIVALAYVLFATQTSDVSYGNKLPYYFVFETLLCFYLSGYFIYFKNERDLLADFFASLPVTFWFWLHRDVVSVAFLSLIIHGFIMPLMLDKISIYAALSLFSYHLLILLICYPVRILYEKSTLYTFFILLAILIFVITLLP